MEQQNASSSEEISATSEEMTSQSMALQRVVHDLRIMVEGGVQEEARTSAKIIALPKKQMSEKRKGSPGPRKLDLENILPLEKKTEEGRGVSKVEGF